ncbi:MAG: hypothetical protein ACKO61_02110 [Actinomycetota bacterium]
MLVGLALIAVGAALLVVTVWFWRASRIDDPVLGPLEVIGSGEFKAADEATRREMLRRARTASSENYG